MRLLDNHVSEVSELIDELITRNGDLLDRYKELAFHVPTLEDDSHYYDITIKSDRESGYTIDVFIEKM